MIDVLRCRPKDAVLSESARHARGRIVLSSRRRGTIGVIEFGPFLPSSDHSWICAELNADPGYGQSCRVRIGDEGGLWYWDESDSMTLKRVSDESSWDSEWSSPICLMSLDMWSGRALRVVVALVATAGSPTPSIAALDIVLSLPTWSGSVAQCAKSISDIVAALRPVLIHSEVLTADKSSWKLGEPVTEHGHVLTEVVACSVDGTRRQATLSQGTVTLQGPIARSGSTVEIAVAYAPQSAVRRMADARVVGKLPAYVVDQLVGYGGMGSPLPVLHVGGVDVFRRMIDLQVKIIGVAGRQADALAMRAALQEAFDASRTVELSSGRTIGILPMDMVEISASGPDKTPACIGTVRCAFEEYTSMRRTTAARRSGAPGTTSITVTNQDQDTSFTADADSAAPCTQGD